MTQPMVTVNVYGDVGDEANPELGVYDFDGLHVNFDEDDTKPTLQCTFCGDYFVTIEDAEDEDAFCMSPESEDDKHKCEPVALSWVNSAGVSCDADEDSVTVSISVGDPRGAFVMQLRRERYTDTDGTEVDEIRMSLPDESDGQPHAGGITPINGRGYYRVKGA